MDSCGDGDAEGGDDSEENSFTFAVVGGGIAGGSCVEQILEFDQEARILLISASPVVKEACQVTRLSKTLVDFLIVEKTLKSFKDVHQSVRVVHGEVAQLLPQEKAVVTKAGQRFLFKKICICSGASPRILFPGWEHVIGIRDTESVADLALKIYKARKVVLLGNGGIATEFVHEANGVEIVWAIKDKSICAHFIDPGAAEFFIQCKMSQSSPLPHSSEEGSSSSSIPTEDAKKDKIVSTKAFRNAEKTPPSKRRKYTITSFSLPSRPLLIKKQTGSGNFGSALGPDWHHGVCLKGQNFQKNVKILYETECTEVRTGFSQESEGGDSWPVFAQMTDGQVIGCDLVISATGVLPNLDLFKGAIDLDPEKGVSVDNAMRTSLPDVFAAGDICFPNWEWSKHWFQMRLWTQARHMGLYAGKSMYMSLRNELNPEEAEPVELDFCFECFSHVTRFFGFKVVLLGLYNGQGLDKSRQHLLIRCTKNLEYIKVVLEDWRMQGAVLIGETGLEETFENLILNQIDLSSYGEDLLNPDIDIEDYFD